METINETIDKNDVLFFITKETVQSEAREKIGRNLTDDELNVAKKGLDWGILEFIHVIYNTILFEMIPEDKKRSDESESS